METDVLWVVLNKRILKCAPDCVEQEVGSCVSVMSVIPESTLSARMFVIALILRIYKITCITAAGSGFAALGQHTSVRIRGVFAFITSVVWKGNVTSQCTGDRVCKFPVPGGVSANPTSRRGAPLPPRPPSRSSSSRLSDQNTPRCQPLLPALLVSTPGRNTVPSQTGGALPV